MPNGQKSNVKLKEVELTAAKRAASARGRYERSTIEFPYNDLDNAVEIAQAISSNGGRECSLDQLAGYLKVSLSGPTRTRFSNARLFGLVESKRGTIRLTSLGRRVVDPETEGVARAEAFLNVPLFSAVFDKYKGYALPRAKGLVGEMRALGVSSTQTDRARQTFMRSARQAGFFAHREDQLAIADRFDTRANSDGGDGSVRLTRRNLANLLVAPAT